MKFNHKLSLVLLSIITSALYFTASAQDSLKMSVIKINENSIGIKYDLIITKKGVHKSGHLLSLEYRQLFKKLPLTARINYSHRFSMNSAQLEIEAYPAISKKVYTYVNAGYSKDILLFPKYRAGFSLYISLPAAYEVEGGFRLLHFNSPTWIYTASLGKYYKIYWFNLSTFLTPVNSSVLQSYFLKIRYYLNDTDYFMLSLGSGISPDNRNNNILLDNNAKLGSKTAEVSLRCTIKKRYVVLFNAGWLSQEFEQKQYSPQYNFGIGLTRNLMPNKK